jgi:hypothetical protein
MILIWTYGLSCCCLKVEGAAVEVLWSKPVDKKLYNARKTLTKAFTHGSEIVDNESGTVQVKPGKRFFIVVLHDIFSK